MLHRHCQIDHGEPVDSGGRGQSMGSERVLTGAVVPNEPNSARVSPGGVNPQRQDCRVASLLAMTSAGREPVMSNKPNSPHFGAENEDRRKNEANFWGREAGHWGFGIADWGFEAAGARNDKQTQFWGDGQSAGTAGPAGWLRKHRESGNVKQSQFVRFQC